MIIRRLLRDRRAGAGLVVAGMMPVLVGFTAFAVDLGAVQLDTRRLQGMADAAALAAASAPTGAAERARAVVSASGFPREVEVHVAPGRYAPDPAVDPAARFQPGTSGPAPVDAVRVELVSTSPTFFARIFAERDVAIARQATARRQRFASFSVGSRLASFNGGLLNGYLTALTGSEVKLTAMDYHALVGAQVDLFDYLSVLRTNADLTAVSYDQVLGSHVSLPRLLQALAQSLLDSGQQGAAEAIRAIANVSGGKAIPLSALIDAGPIGPQATIGRGIAEIDALSLLTAMLQLASHQRQVAVDLGTAIDGVASTRLILAVGERQQHAPWITVTDSGATIVRTAQARVYLQIRLLPLSLPGIGSLAQINLPILLELAGAQGRLGSIDCPAGGTRSVLLEGRTDIGSAAIGTVTESQLGNFAAPLEPGSATLVDTLALDLIGSSRISLGGVETWQKLRFSEAEIANRTRKTIASGTPAGGIAASLMSHADLRARTLLGITVPADALIQAVGAAVTPIAPALDSLLRLATGTLGVGIGEADLQVTGMRCGQAVLVA